MSRNIFYGPLASLLWLSLGLGTLLAIHAGRQSAAPARTYLHKANMARIAISWDLNSTQLAIKPEQIADTLQLDIAGLDGLTLNPVQYNWSDIRPGNSFHVPVPLPESLSGSGRLVVRAVLSSGSRSTSRIAVFQIGTELQKAYNEEPVYFGGERVHVHALPE